MTSGTKKTASLGWFRWFLLWSLFCLATNSSIILGYWAARWNAPLAAALLFLAPGLILPAFCAACTAVATAVFGLFPRLRRSCFLILCCSLMFCACYVAANSYSGSISRANYRIAAEQGGAIIEAIKRYENDHAGEPPASLARLKPGYISELPSTGLATSPDFQYTAYTGTCGRQHEPRWELAVHASQLPDAGTLFYWPEQKYPARSGPREVERIGVWAFVSD